MFSHFVSWVIELTARPSHTNITRHTIFFFFVKHNGSDPTIVENNVEDE